MRLRHERIDEDGEEDRARMRFRTRFGLSANVSDDVKFVSALLDDLSTVCNVDAKRVYATGISNGGMMCYRLAAELSGRIAAIAPVSGTIAIDEVKPKRSVPIMHFHGTADRVVPLQCSRKMSARLAEAEVASQLHLVEGASHIGAFLDKTAREKAILFLDQHLQR